MSKIWGLDKNPVITTTSWFDSLFSNFIKNEYKEWHDVFNTSRVRVSDTQESYRTINYWDEQGLLLNDRKNSDKWRQFSALDVVWIKVLKAAKQYGMKNEQLLKLKEYLFYIESEFEFWIYFSLAEKDCVLIVLPDGRGSIAIPQDVEIAHKHFGLGESFVTINFTQIVLSVLKGSKDTKGRKKHPLVDLQEKEYDLLSKLRQDEVEEVSAIKRNGKVDRIEWKVIQKTPEILLSWLSEKIKENDNQTFTFKQQDGKILFVEQKVSKK
jgi:hypothetical protein